MSQKMTRSQFRKEKEEILELFESDLTALPAEGKAERKREAQKDFFRFMEIYLPHYAENAPADFHREIIAEIEKPTKVVHPLVIAAPRGFAKSAVISFAYVIWNILFKRKNFIVIISATDDLAEDMVEFAKLEFENNPIITADFGHLLQGFGEKKDFVANGVRVMSRGRKQMVRGFRYKQHRPDLIILDDIEKDDEARSPDVVKKTLDTIKDGVYPSLAPGGKLVIIGTILQKRSVMGTLIRGTEEPYDKWRRKLYRAITVNEKGKEASLWQSRWPLHALKATRENIGAVSFNREYQNNPGDDETALFKEEWIKRFVKMHGCTRGAMFIDPSVDGRKTSDFKAIITVFLNPDKMDYYVMHAWVKRATIEAMIAAAYRIYTRFEDIVTLVGLESNGFQKVLVNEFRREEKEQGFALPIRQVVHRTSKIGRLERISPLVERGQIHFSKSDDAGDMNLLIEQLLYFPSTVVNDDAPDALAGAIELLGSGSREAKLTSSGRRNSSSILRGYKSRYDGL